MGKLIVYSASAGSGKTYRIVGNYIQMLFAGELAYRNVLAVTFTNKAGEEMKTRIIKELDIIASGKSSDYIPELCNTYNLTEEQIRLKAKRIFKQILHDYSHFAVSTIDSFFQKILKSFAWETGIQYNYEIELNSEQVVSEIVDNLMIKADEDKNLKNSVIALINNNINEGKKWDARYSLKNFINSIFNSDFRKYETEYNRLFDKPGLFSNFRKNLNNIISDYEKLINQFIEEFNQILYQYAISPEDFKNKSRAISFRILKLEEKIKTDSPEIVLQDIELVEKWLNNDQQKDQKYINATDKIIELCLMYRPILSENYKDYKFAGIIKNQLFYIAIISHAFKEINIYKSENNKFLISEVPEFLSQIAQNNSSSFIYEKAGSYYHNYLIDEFQDTSRKQWDSFRPLIEESLANSNPANNNILVGDVKQSIYGWRGGDWQLLADDVKKVFSHFYHEIGLDINYRSGKHIIEFNNTFFEKAATKLQTDFNSKLTIDTRFFVTRITDSIYDRIRQSVNPKSKIKGYVELNVLKKAEDTALSRENSMIKMMEQIEFIQAKKYNAGDIMILVRRNKDGKDIADYILDYSRSEKAKKDCNYSVISADSLFIATNEAVCFIISCLRYLLDKNNTLAYTEAAMFFYRINVPVALQEISVNLSDFYKEFDNKMQYAEENITAKTLSEITENLILIFELNKTEINIPFLTSFKDIVHERSQKVSPDIWSFLEWWDEFGDKQTLKIPEKQNAITIITGHKSKGLAANFVIIPFCDWSLVSNTGIVWCSTKQTPYDILPAWPLNFNSSLKDTPVEMDYEIERFNKSIEALNIMYVAFTRAKKGLFINATNRDVSKSGLVTVGQLLELCLNEIIAENNPDFITENTENPDADKYYIGEIKVGEPDDNNEKYFNEYPVYIPDKKPVIKSFSDDESITDTDNSGIKKGIIYHSLFERIENKSDIDKALKKMLNQGLINTEELESIKSETENIFNHNLISSWFDDTYKVYNEKDIFTGDGYVKRPDRIMIKNDKAIVVDYKFGHTERSSYIKQIKEYGALLKAIGFKNIEMYVWYVFSGKLISLNDDGKQTEILIKKT
jgi:ATP-dependent helicase/nuclease subunit A